MIEFVDFRTLERPRSPNTYVMAPDGLCERAEPDTVSPIFGLDADSLFQAVLHLVEETKDWMLQDSDSAARRLVFVAETPLLRFKDDVDVGVFPSQDGQGAQLAVYSRSRIGHYDFGANAKRVRSLVEKLGAVRIGP